MKTLIALLAFVMVSQAHAQGQSGSPVGGESDAAVVVPVESSNQTEAAPANSQGNPIYIINKNSAQAPQEAASQGPAAKAAAVQEQPATVVQDTPLRANPADQMRKRRQQTETATEDGIVTALERARLDDEMKRRDKFNSAIGPVSQDTTAAGSNAASTAAPQTIVAQQAPPAPVAQAAPPQPVTQAVVAAQPVAQQVAPQPVAQPVQRINVVEEDEISDNDLKDSRKDDKTDMKQEIRSAIAENNKYEDKNGYYVAGLASFGQYNNVANINSSLGYGVAVGTVLPSRIVVEGTFLYGDYAIQNSYSVYGPSYGGGYGGYLPSQVDMRQYDVGGAVKYELLPGRFKPVVGGILNYARRSYAISGQEFMTSDAIDVGALVGADLQLADTFAIGVDFRYFTNLGARQNIVGGQTVYQQANDPEKLDYYTLNLIGKFTF